MLSILFNRDRLPPETRICVNPDRPLPEFPRGQKITNAHLIWAEHKDDKNLVYISLQTEKRTGLLSLAKHKERFFLTFNRMSKEQEQKLVSELRDKNIPISQINCICIN